MGRGEGGGEDVGGNWNKMERPLNQPAELETLAYQKP